jgi:hypothetical protein
MIRITVELEPAEAQALAVAISEWDGWYPPSTKFSNAAYSKACAKLFAAMKAAGVEQ